MLFMRGVLLFFTLIVVLLRLFFRFLLPPWPRGCVVSEVVVVELSFSFPRCGLFARESLGRVALVVEAFVALPAVGGLAQIAHVGHEGGRGRRERSGRRSRGRMRCTAAVAA
jgi:hypothetical protein